MPFLVFHMSPANFGVTCCRYLNENVPFGLDDVDGMERMGSGILESEGPIDSKDDSALWGSADLYPGDLCGAGEPTFDMPSIGVKQEVSTNHATQNNAASHDTSARSTTKRARTAASKGTRGQIHGVESTGTEQEIDAGATRAKQPRKRRSSSVPQTPQTPQTPLEQAVPPLSDAQQEQERLQQERLLMQRRQQQRASMQQQALQQQQRMQRAMQQSGQQLLQQPPSPPSQQQQDMTPNQMQVLQALSY
jgi:hypothetical protein